MTGPPGRVLVVTGTGTGVGKTVATAALAVRAAALGSVVAVKPVQTGVLEADDGDAAEVHRLAGCAVQELTALPDPLAPETAARLRGLRLPPVAEHADRIRVLAGFHDTVLVEGAGGLLVRLDSDGGTLLDLVDALPDLAVSVVVVAAAGLGTLNHTGLTVAALRSRGVEPAGLVVGSWPAEPGLAERCNAEDLPRLTGVPLLGRLPAGAGSLEPEDFRASAPAWVDLPGAGAVPASSEPVVTRTTGAELARAYPAQDATVGGMEGRERQQILDRFLLGGRLVQMPAKRSRRLVVLDHLAQSFEPGVKYTEPEVNAALRGFDDDVAALRRYLVDEGFLAREAGVYWRSGGSVDLGSAAGPRPGGS